MTGTFQTTVLFPEWPLLKEGPRAEWGLLNLTVTVEHDGRVCDCWEIAEIELDPVFPEQSERRPVPETLRPYIEAEIRGREEDRDRIRVAISEDLPVRLRRAA